VGSVTHITLTQESRDNIYLIEKGFSLNNCSNCGTSARPETLLNEDQTRWAIMCSVCTYSTSSKEEAYPLSEDWNRFRISPTREVGMLTLQELYSVRSKSDLTVKSKLEIDNEGWII
jgi:hypothetical protein